MCHHPTIIAAHSEGRRWRLEGDAELKSKFWGRSIELHPLGLLRLTFADGDEYTWSKALPPSVVFPLVVLFGSGLERTPGARRGPPLSCALLWCCDVAM